jgi:hypothetical protein
MCNLSIVITGSGHLHSLGLGAITVNNAVNLHFPGESTVHVGKKYYRTHGERLHKSLNNAYIHSKV